MIELTLLGAVCWLAIGLGITIFFLRGAPAMVQSRIRLWTIGVLLWPLLIWFGFRR